jgi:SAM-dependent methyltransferase
MSRPSRSWDAVASWYAGWNGSEGSRHHRQLAIPALLDLLALRPGEALIDLGCGPGVLAPAVVGAGARYTGVDLSPRLIGEARRNHGREPRFLVGDATRLDRSRIGGSPFDAAAFLLSIQDIAPLDGAIRSAVEVLRPGGRLAIVMTHPCFRIPRQSGWGWDEQRRLQFRRVDRYLTPLDVPMRVETGRHMALTTSYHRPLEAYVGALAEAGCAVDALREISGGPVASAGLSRAEAMARREIPLFLGLRAVRRE